jgi:hypothetical protein
MAKAKGLTYEELIEYVGLFGPITKRGALVMFRTSYEVDREHAAMAAR